MKNIPQYIPEVFYDIIGYFLPGIILTYSLLALFQFTYPQEIVNVLSIVKIFNNSFISLSFLIAVSYTTGHIISYPSRILTQFVKANDWGNMHSEKNKNCLSRSFYNEMVKKFSIDEGDKSSKIMVDVERKIVRITEKYIKVICPELGQFIQKRQALRVMHRNLSFSMLVIATFMFIHFDIFAISHSVIVLLLSIASLVRYSHMTTSRCRDVEICYGITLQKEILKSGD